MAVCVRVCVAEGGFFALPPSWGGPQVFRIGAKPRLLTECAGGIPGSALAELCGCIHVQG
jgi:hypothetical protein